MNADRKTLHLSVLLVFVVAATLSAGLRLRLFGERVLVGNLLVVAIAPLLLELSWRSAKQATPGKFRIYSIPFFWGWVMFWLANVVIFVGTIIP
jgi:hypothetical protein